MEERFARMREVGDPRAGLREERRKLYERMRS